MRRGGRERLVRARGAYDARLIRNRACRSGYLSAHRAVRALFVAPTVRWPATRPVFLRDALVGENFSRAIQLPGVKGRPVRNLPRVRVRGGPGPSLQTPTGRMWEQPADDSAMESTVELCVTMRDTCPGDAVGVIGGAPGLGAWARAVPLAPSPYPVWRGAVLLPPDADLEYKYVLLRADGTNRWEPIVGNRLLRSGGAGGRIVVRDARFGVRRRRAAGDAEGDAEGDTEGKARRKKEREEETRAETVRKQEALLETIRAERERLQKTRELLREEREQAAKLRGEIDEVRAVLVDLRALLTQARAGLAAARLPSAQHVAEAARSVEDVSRLLRLVRKQQFLSEEEAAAPRPQLTGGIRYAAGLVALAAVWLFGGLAAREVVCPV